MKKILPFLCLLLIISGTMAQGMTLRFTGRTDTGSYVRLDSVKVENITRSWTETLVYPDTVLTLTSTGISGASANNASIKVFPNPCDGKTNLSLLLADNDDVALRVFDLTGREVASFSKSLEAGNYMFDLCLSAPQVYIAVVSTSKGRSTVKMVNRGRGSMNSISAKNVRKIHGKRLSQNEFLSGDEFRYLGYAVSDGQVVVSRLIQQSQRTSEDFTMFFGNMTFPTVRTDTITNILDVSAVCGVSVLNSGGYPVTDCGVCYGTNPNPTTADSISAVANAGLGVFICNVTNLTPRTTYHVRAYATTLAGTAYGAERFFTTIDVPSVITDMTTNITGRTATCAGEVLTDGGSPITERGICYDTTPNPTTANRVSVASATGLGSYACNLVNLFSGTTYYIRAYATNAAGTSYGAEERFTTLSLASVTTDSIMNITDTSATFAGNVVSNGGGTVLSRGFCYSNTQNPTIADSLLVASSSGLGSYTCNVSGLAAGTTYYVRAYATTYAGTSYGVQKAFTTLSLPSVITYTVFNVGPHSATGGGSVISDGGSAITARGVCYDTVPNPTILGNNIADTLNQAGGFVLNFPNLVSSATYYVRAYAVNSVGLTYGSEVNFTTLQSSVPAGALNGAFSVDSNRVVHFSQGNLQWSATGGDTVATVHNVAGGGTSAGTWRFAEHQYDFVGDSFHGNVYADSVKCNNANISPSYTGWIDLFGWGTSGYGNKNPYTRGDSVADYAHGSDMAGTNYDWGIYNDVFNPTTMTTDTAETWRTLTKSEWDYMMNSRTDAATKYGLACVKGVDGLVILPDTWTLPAGMAFVSGCTGYSQNVYGASQWRQMENNGAVFLPKALYRKDTLLSGEGQYWSSSHNGNDRAYYLDFAQSGVSTNATDSCSEGRSVRLVCDDTIIYAMPPNVQTDSVLSVTDTSLLCRGNVVFDGGSPITSRGFCYSVNPLPTIADSVVMASTNGTGYYTCAVTGLSANTVYYVRAFAANMYGMAYGKQEMVRTANVRTFSAALFSVASNRQVTFSPGNLQWSATGGGTTPTTHAVSGGGNAAGTWRFALHQYDFVGDDTFGNVYANGVKCSNGNVSSSYSGWIDLFGWGTSGFGGKFPYMTSRISTDYGNGNADISGTDYDWGVYNAISNGGNQSGQWRTLTNDEWTYLLQTRANAGNKYGVACVNGVNGLVILPDIWVLPNGLSFSSGCTGYTQNVYTAVQWQLMEANGAVFLPAAGFRRLRMWVWGVCGQYWTSTAYAYWDGVEIAFDSNSLYHYTRNREYANSVRLVRDTVVLPLPVVTTDTATNITCNSATCQGTVVSGMPITARGICYATTHNPTTANNSVAASSNGTGAYTCMLSNLAPNTTYYFRAYATNFSGISYGAEKSFTTDTVSTPVIALNGLFSVDTNRQVKFSSGNLQWSATGGGTTPTTHAVSGGGTAAGTWRFALHQYDYVGFGNLGSVYANGAKCDNDSISSSYTGWIDLFGWGTSGYNSKYPYMVSLTDTDYGFGQNDITGTNYDWGVYNAIINGGNAPGIWRTLTTDEWKYLLDTRSASTINGTPNARYAEVSVNGVPGLMIFPDVFTWPSGAGAAPTIFDACTYSLTTVNYSSSQFATLESCGVVFLPASSVRTGTSESINRYGYNGAYWSSTSGRLGGIDAYFIQITPGWILTQYLCTRAGGLAVRLVRDAH